MRSKSAQSLFVSGVYLIFLGSALLLAPHTGLSLMGLPDTNEVLLRTVEFLLLGFAFYYIQVARHNVAAVFPWTIYTRSLVIIFWGIMVAQRIVRPVVLFGGLIDLIAAIWTAIAIRADKAVTSDE